MINFWMFNNMYIGSDIFFLTVRVKARVLSKHNALVCAWNMHLGSCSATTTPNYRWICVKWTQTLVKNIITFNSRRKILPLRRRDPVGIFSWSVGWCNLKWLMFNIWNNYLFILICQITILASPWYFSVFPFWSDPLNAVCNLLDCLVFRTHMAMLSSYYSIFPRRVRETFRFNVLCPCCSNR